jgi:hypothetical protein
MGKKRRPGPPRGTGTVGPGVLVGPRRHDAFLEAVDMGRGQQEVPPFRAAAVRRHAEIALGSGSPRGKGANVIQFTSVSARPAGISPRT